MLNLADAPILGADQRLIFSLYDPSPLGIVAIHGNLSPGVLLSAYRQGVFPWYDDESPILWWSPDPRFILRTDRLHISKTNRKFLRNCPFSLSVDRAFPRVIRHCAKVPREGQVGTWIVSEMEEAYNELHRLGYAHSVEVWRGEKLVGGLYGVSLGRVFFGESMFSLESNASKSAFILLTLELRERGFRLVDCQVYTRHLENFGAEEVPREEFLALLAEGLRGETLKGPWSEMLDLDGLRRRIFGASRPLSR
ncbi:MAG TPA: leucyl/phenylalanyl-tRNA--protein transferase [Sediminispirochaeta sp.]|nr:leucyl/phenylalanyl-tRNA--protein transferase [Sediminispirochaeta sp.]